MVFGFVKFVFNSNCVFEMNSVVFIVVVFRICGKDSRVVVRDSWY